MFECVNIRNSCLKVFSKKSALKSSAKFTEKYPGWRMSFNKMSD